MFRQLAPNVFISGVAYFVISAIGLVLAPVLIAAYGLAGYGQILLSRIFLPSATFGLMDMGVGENTTRIVAEARSHGNTDHAAMSILLLAVIALVVSFILGAAVSIAARDIAAWMKIAPEQREGFVAVLRLTAALEPLLFVALVSEGVLKGFENFRLLRSIEIFSALTYGGLALYAAGHGLGPNQVALALVGTQALRAVIATVSAFGHLRRGGIGLARWTPEIRQEIFAWSKTMFATKSLGTLQTQASSPLLGLLIGPAAVGLYDSIVRIPRFAKSVFALVGSAVLPLSARLRAAGDHDNTRRLAHVGMVGSFVMCAPPAVMGAIFAEPLLKLWLGPQIAIHWLWLAVMLAVPLANMPRSFAGNVILPDQEAVRILNRLFLLQIVLQIAISVVLLRWIEPWSFVIGEVVTVLAMLPVQLGIIARRLGMESTGGGKMVVMLFVSGVVGLAVRHVVPVNDPVMLVIALALGGVLAWLAALFLVLDKGWREALFAALRCAMPGR